MSLWILGGVVVIGSAYLLLRTRPDDPVSPEWLVENEHRSWREGIDGPAIRFPILKIENEQSWRQTERLRRRA